MIIYYSFDELIVLENIFEGNLLDNIFLFSYTYIQPYSMGQILYIYSTYPKVHITPSKNFIVFLFSDINVI